LRHRKRDDRMSRSVSLLISMLVRYPEVGTVKYEPGQQTLRMSLLIHGDLPEEEFARVEEALFDSLEVYHMLEQRQPTTVEVDLESYSGLTAIAITRDAQTLSPEEIYMIVEFFRERFAGRLVTEPGDFQAEDEMLAQDELIEEILAELEEGRNGRNLIAIREDGRVMVFQK
jgi:hypothetical protein